MKRFISAVTSAAVSLTAMLTVMTPATVSAVNPLAQNVYTADPSPMVYDGKIYLYTSHDKDGNNDFFKMPDWQCYSTTDMQNWTHHGTVFSGDDFSFAETDTAWATQCVERNGKFYMYCPLSSNTGGGRVIGVGVADKPEGPFKDALGKPLVGPNWDFIDPTVFIDDDGQAYLYFGNPQLYYVKLNEDMISYSGSIEKIDMNAAGFGSGEGGKTLYTEGPWFYKRGDLYYMLYAASGIPENICYSTSPTPTGPWTYRGVIMPKGEEGAAFTNHCGVCDYKDHSYFFYHNQRLPGGGGFNRSVAVEEFTYKSDGSFPTIRMSKEGPAQLETLDPYQKTQAETFCELSGIEIEPCSNGGTNVANVENGDYVRVSGVDFGDGAETFKASVASATDGGKLELHLDSATGPVIGTCTVTGTGGWQKWEEVSCEVSGAKGEHDLYLRFTGGSGFLFNIDWWQFGSSSYIPPEPTTPPVVNSDYYFHDTFESGTNGWEGRGAAKVSSSSEEKYEGKKSLLTNGRSDAWNGASKKLSTSTFKPGSEYSFSVNVMCPKENSNTKFYLTLQYTVGEEVNYDKIAIGTAVGGEWIQLANQNYKIPANATDLYFYVETDSGKNNFYLDEAIGAKAGTIIEGAGASKYLPGDVTCDGMINVMDVVAAKYGLKKGFDNAAAELNADIDGNGTFSADDITYLQQYIVKKITEFPKVDPPEPEKVPFDYEPNVSYKEAPGNYFDVSSKAGKIITESYNGINGANKLKVYLPYGYDESKKYNVFYLMHGGGENENTIFSDDVKFDKILDHMIENGELEPMIVVTPTFNKCQAETVWKEMKESIVPFVEGKYSTYAEDTTPAGLEESRMHRAYGGFSMGGGSTWNVLINDIDYFAYYMPLSGHCWGGAGAVADAVKNSKYKDSTYIFAATGTEDIAYGNLKPQIEELKKRTDVFTYTSDFSKGNLYFLEAADKTHWWGFVRHYVYDGLPYFFHE